MNKLIINKKVRSDQTVFYIENLISAGFPSPSEHYASESLNLHDLLIKNPLATFFIRVKGDSMEGEGIKSGDILVVDRSLEPKSGKIIVAVLDGEFTVKKIEINSKKEISLIAANPNYPVLQVKECQDFQVWGVVSYVIHKT